MWIQQSGFLVYIQRKWEQGCGRHLLISNNIICNYIWQLKYNNHVCQQIMDKRNMMYVHIYIHIYIWNGMSPIMRRERKSLLLGDVCMDLEASCWVRYQTEKDKTLYNIVYKWNIKAKHVKTEVEWWLQGLVAK